MIFESYNGPQMLIQDMNKLYILNTVFKHRKSENTALFLLENVEYLTVEQSQFFYVETVAGEQAIFRNINVKYVHVYDTVVNGLDTYKPGTFVFSQNSEVFYMENSYITNCTCKAYGGALFLT